MNPKLYSSKEFIKLKEDINKEIKARGTFKWWDPLVPPLVGQDRSAPLTLPSELPQQIVSDKTYTIDNPSNESLEPTKNVNFPSIGDNPSDGANSSSKVEVDEMRNFLLGLSKILDINLYYGRDEDAGLAFRDPNNIAIALDKAKLSELNKLLHQSPLSATKNDPNGGMVDQKNPNYPVSDHNVTYPMEDGKYVMPSGELNGEEGIPNENNFFDDYKLYNTNVTERVDRSWEGEGRNRDQRVPMYEGGIHSSTYGQNPRNPNPGTPYRSRPVYGGVPGACNVACTGMCSLTCDNSCSESCTTTCFNRCGNACTATCGNVCTGCTNMCKDGCTTQCDNVAGYSCLHAGVVPGRAMHSCEGCSFTCRFYPNKSALCTDSACKTLCVNSCMTGCMQTCSGGCMNNRSENTSYTNGIGAGCRNHCTINCVGACQGVCVGLCVQSCWSCCKATCHDNCAWSCDTQCGFGCDNGCILGCTNDCTSSSSTRPSGCGVVGCSSACKQSCNNNCVGIGCRSICGIEGSNSCEANCRMSCVNASCSAMCSNACFSQCSTCVNSCGFNCGNVCRGTCGGNCESGCSDYCTMQCQQNCTNHCMFSCSNECSGCSNLCYSCVGMCIGNCSVRCQDGCSSCSNNCSWWCDTSCNRACFNSCDNRCINTCSGHCMTLLQSETTSNLTGPTILPSSRGYSTPNPSNRLEELESLKIVKI